MAETVGEFVIKRLVEWGVRRIYGYPGDGITAGLRHSGDAIEFVQVRHEETAAFCACAHAKYSGGELGDVKYEATQDLPDVPYARWAELLGLKGIRVDHPDQIGPAWDEALAADRPVVLEAIVDPDVPPLPPHITIEEASAMARSLLKGDPDARGVVRQTLRELIDDFVH